VRDEHEVPRPGLDGTMVEVEGQLALQHVERLVGAPVQVRRRPGVWAAIRYSRMAKASPVCSLAALISSRLPISRSDFPSPVGT
jgi:hypothetical protein